MRVSNINGTSNSTTTCKCGSCLKHWFNYSALRSYPIYCCEKDCLEKELEGAHVQKAGSTDNNWYIVPLCSKHNKSDEILELSSSAYLTRANKSETCEKS